MGFCVSYCVMVFRYMMLVLCCLVLVCWSREIDQDVALPAINFRFDYASQDYETGGPAQTAYEDMTDFKQKVKSLHENMDHDAQVLITFYNETLNHLRQIASIFGGRRPSKRTLQTHSLRAT